MNGYYEQRNPSQQFTRLLVALAIGLIAMGAFAIRGCERGPFGRRQLVGLSPAQENALGAQAFQEILNESPVVTTGPIVREVQEVTRRLIQATRSPRFQQMSRIPLRDYQWDVRVIDSREQNAFCLPGGKMVVYTGILPICQTDAGLATVMGHEIAHALARHGAERMAQTRMAQIGVVAAGGSLGTMDPADRRRVIAILNAGARFGILHYSRAHESEADHLGLLLMAVAGYNPEESVKFWERMAAGKQGRVPEFLSTHPSHETRIRDLVNWIPEAMPLYHSSGHSDPPRRLSLSR